MKLWETLRQAQVGEGLVRAVQSLYMECEARVKVGEKQLEWFNVDQGVRQGCVFGCYYEGDKRGICRRGENRE